MNQCKSKRFKHFLFVFPLIMMSLSISAQNLISVKGVITDTGGEPLLGVSVLEIGTLNGTVSDLNGRFSINVSQGASLRFSFVGFETVELPANAVMNVTLPEKESLLDELVIIGYGVQKKSVITAAISSVKASDMEKRTPTRIDNMLQGQVSGVSITQHSGQPGSEVTMRIRGIGTTGDNTPLYIIDGMAVNGGIRNINPLDIESIEILKDASAAIYGTRGGNGVVLITTKKGKEGKPKIEYDMNLGWQNPWRRVPLLNTEQYMALHNERLINNNQTPLYSYKDFTDARAGLMPNTDWQDVAFSKNAPISNHQVSINGGNEKGKYYLSLGRFSQDGILGGKYGASNYDRWTIRSNNEYEVLNSQNRKILNKLRIGVNATYSRANSTSLGNNEVFGTILASVIALPPFMTPYLDEVAGLALLEEQPTALVHNGKVLTPTLSEYRESLNPLAFYLQPDRTFYEEDKFIGNFWGELNIFKGLVFRTNFGYDLAFWGNNGYRFPHFKSYYETRATDTDPAMTRAWNEMNRAFTRQIENTLTYDFSISKHSVTLLAGQSARDGFGRYLRGEGLDLKVYDPDMAIINNARMDIREGGRRSNGYTWTSALASYFGRISYNYAERYMFQAILRYDGSYKFGANNKWGTFPSLSIGWNVWNEPYLESVKPLWWNILKIRGSWGINGSDRINEWAYMSLMESDLNYYFGGNGNETLYYGISSGRLPNPFIHWEESQQANAGLDLGFFRNSLTLTVDWFYKQTKAMLREAATVPGYVGQSPPFVNAGTIDNTGIEMDLVYRFSPVKDLNLSFKANASYVKNTVVNYGDAAGENGWGGIGAAGIGDFIYHKNGYPNPFFYGYVTDGIFQSIEEVKAHKIQPNAQPGDVRFKDINNDGILDDKDREIIGKPVPDWTFGFTFSTDYKGIDFHLFLQGIQGVEIFDIVRRTDFPEANLPTWFMDRWTGPGTSDKYPRIVSGEANNNWRASDLYIKDGSYLRIKNIQIGYTVPQLYTKKAGMERVRIWIGSENLFTFTKYDGFDPEIGDGQIGVSRMGNYPVARTLNCGIGITF